MTNTTELKIAMFRKHISMDELAKRIGISTASLSYKTNNKREFTSTEIKMISEVLCLSVADREMIFFAEEVD